MSCLDNYIGLKICGAETSESGLFINSLPGISLEMIDASAESEQITYAGVWRDAQAEAWQQFFIDFIDQTAKCFQLDPYCDYAGLICDNKQRLAVAWKYLLGAQLMLFRIYSPRINRFTTIDSEQARELLGLYQAEYEKSLSQAVKLIDVSSCTACMECGGNPETVTWLP